MTTIKIASGFDRGIDYEDIKNNLIKDFEEKLNALNQLSSDIKNFESRNRILINQLTYLILSLIQLRNGSRSIEAVWAFREFIKNRNFKDTILVKIAKSEGIKYDRKTHKQYKSKIRYRKIVYPITWITIEDSLYDQINNNIKNISDDRLKKRTLDYLLKYHNSNTHSLRYCFINYMIHEKKVPLNDVSKTVGHVDLTMLTRYTQAKNIDKVLDIDK